jgi:hypothetical protein
MFRHLQQDTAVERRQASVLRLSTLPRPQGAEVGSTRLSAFRFPFFVLAFVIASEAKQSSAAVQELQPLRSAHRPRWIASSLRSSQ